MSELLSNREIIELLVKLDRPFAPENQPSIRTPKKPSPDLFGIDPFNDPNAKQRVVTALDTINARYGLKTVYFGSVHQVRKEAPTRIPFGPPRPLEEFDDTADKLRTPRGPRGIRAQIFPECSGKRQRLVGQVEFLLPIGEHQ